MIPSIESHLPWLDEVVLIVQKSDDATVELAYQIQQKYPTKIRIAHYPAGVVGIGTPEHFSLPENSIRTMMHLTNWSIYQCKYSWVAKIEGDVIALSTFAKIREAIDNEPDKICYYGRLGLNIAGEDYTYVFGTHPRNAGWDEGVFNNHPLWHCIRYDKWESVNMNEHRDKLINMGFSFLHVKRCKAEQERLREPEQWVAFDRENTCRVLTVYNRDHGHPGPDNFCPDVLFERTTLSEY